MCLFEYPNENYNGPAYKKGVTSFKCGACPECLAEKARKWALRAVFEAQYVPSMMVTLTYDSYIRDGRGRIIGEQVSDRTVLKRDCQLFIKRLRKWCTKVYSPDHRMKYLITAEYGKRTHRAHYHALLFNVEFPDIVPYKYSKRGNPIYQSKILSEIWHNGICTVDSVNLSAACARYCTKYCAKDARTDDTFMLFSRGIGEFGLMGSFNGISYWVDGREYPIPRQIWEKVISDRYKDGKVEFSPKYVSPRCDDENRYLKSVQLRQNYFIIRDSDEQYKSYLAYWAKKGELYEKRLAPPLIRILQLPNDKYYAYKMAALECITRRTCGTPGIDLGLPSWAIDGFPVPPPRSGCKSRYNRWLFVHHLPLSSCYIAANDTPYNEKQEKAIDQYHRKRFIQSVKALAITDPLSSEWADCPISWRLEDFSIKF